MFSSHSLKRKDLEMNNNQNNIDKNTQTASLPTATSKKRKRKKIVIKPNKEGVLSLIALVLIIALVATAVVFLAQFAIKFFNTEKETSSTDDPTPPGTTPWNSAYVPTPWANSNVLVGDLILVNANNFYSLADSLKDRGSTNLYGYEGHGSYYVLPNSDVRVRSTILPYLKQMIVDMVDQNSSLGVEKDADKIYISAAYRDSAKQEELNTLAPSVYPETSGYSEHHTGLVFDIKVQSNGAYISLRDNEYEWLEANCAKYGFVFRYDNSKASLTGIADEPNHLRYVGVSHATYMTENNLCLEEYLELLRNSHSYEQSPLAISAEGKNYLVYYVKATTEDGASFTSIPVPPTTEGTYTISGDNMNGFIITVEKTVATQE